MLVERNQLHVVIEDDGMGLVQARGNGQGLALHSTLVAIAGGSLGVDSIPGRITRAMLLMPLGDGVGVVGG